MPSKSAGPSPSTYAVWLLHHQAGRKSSRDNRNSSRCELVGDAHMCLLSKSIVRPAKNHHCRFSPDRLPAPARLFSRSPSSRPDILVCLISAVSKAFLQPLWALFPFGCAVSISGVRAAARPVVRSRSGVRILVPCFFSAFNFCSKCCLKIKSLALHHRTNL